MVLGSKFFERSAVAVAPELLGKFLVKRRRSKNIALMITEVEAYEGPKDKASHAYRGLTKRNRPMFGPPGYWYVYLTYGMYWMLNIVTDKEGEPSAILIRSVAPDIRYPQYCSFSPQATPPSAGRISDVANIDAVKLRSSLELNGPGKLTKALHIDKAFNDKPASKKTGLWLEDRGVRFPSVIARSDSDEAISKTLGLPRPYRPRNDTLCIKKSPRIGVDYAGPTWSKKHYRFYIPQLSILRSIET